MVSWMTLPRRSLITPHGPSTERSGLVEMRAAVDDDHLSGDAVVSADRHDLLRDVGSVRGAPQHHALARAIDHLGRDSPGHARALDETGGDAVHGDLGGERHRETTREMDEGRLARCVAERAAHRYQARHGGDVDDAPAS